MAQNSKILTAKVDTEVCTFRYTWTRISVAGPRHTFLQSVDKSSMLLIQSPLFVTAPIYTYVIIISNILQVIYTLNCYYQIIAMRHWFSQMYFHILVYMIEITIFYETLQKNSHLSNKNTVLSTNYKIVQLQIHMKRTQIILMTLICY